MTPRKAPLTLPPLENFYTVSEAAIRLGLRKEEDPRRKGEKWLRDGFNRPADGSKGPKFPGRYMAGLLMFSESELALIAELARNATQVRTRRPRRRRPLAAAA